MTLNTMILSTMISLQLLIEHDFKRLIDDAFHEIIVDELTFPVLVESRFVKMVMKRWINGKSFVGGASWNLIIALLLGLLSTITNICSFKTMGNESLFI